LEEKNSFLFDKLNGFHYYSFGKKRKK